MFAKFNYLPNHYYYNTYFNSHLETGRQIYNDMEKRSRECLHEFILQNGHIDGSALKEHWFNNSKEYPRHKECKDDIKHLRTNKGKEDITGYDFEPWHLRYIGKEIAEELYLKNITLEEWIE